MTKHARLTDKGLERQRPPETGRLTIYDTTLPNFGVRVGQRSKSFFVQYRIRGNPERRRYVLKPPFPGISVSEARDQAKEVLKIASKGRSPEQVFAEREAEEKRARDAEARRQKDTVASVAEDFIRKHLTHLRDKKKDEARLRREIIERWGSRSVHDLTRRDVKELVDEVLLVRVVQGKQLGGPYAANRTLALVRKFFNWAIDELIIESNPAAGLKRPGQESPRHRVLSEEEIKRLWPVWTAMGAPFGHHAKLLLLTGQRRGEVARMRWEDVDLSNALWTIRTEFVKNKRQHQVPLSPTAFALIKSVTRLEGCPWVFSTNGETPISGFGKPLQRASTAADVSGWTLHDLRRTVETNLAAERVPEHISDRVLNHAQRGMRRVYDQYSYLQEKREALELWDRVLREIVEGRRRKVVQLRQGAA